MVDELHLSHYRRLLWREHDLLVVRGGLAEARISRDLYVARHGIPLATGLAAAELDRALAGAALCGVALVDRESWGWSITLPGRDFGLFVGLEAEGMLCGRVGPAERDRALVVLQRQKAGGPLVQSTYEPSGADPVAGIEEYYRLVEQVPTRVAVTDGWEGVLIQALPGGDLAPVAGLGADELVALIDGRAAAGALEPMHEVLVFYECRCNEELVRAMLSSLPASERAALFGAERELSVECPRCGREYAVPAG
jgi:hypothetical protein